MFLHYGIEHAQPIVLAGVSLLTFAAGLLVGSWSRTGDGKASTAPTGQDIDR